MTKTEPKKGSLLLAEPFMLDSNFKRSVILLCDNQEEGSVGFILNKPMKMYLPEAIPEVNDFEAPLFYGGPVEADTLHFVHNLGDLVEGSIHIADDTYWGGNFEDVKSLINQRAVGPDNFKFFLGYSGWSSGQLDEEMEENSWIVTKSSSEYIFDNLSPNLWKKVLEDLGGKYKIISNYPEDPSLN